MIPKAWREELGFDMVRMGAFIGVLPRTWYNYETGLRTPPLDVIARCQRLSGGRVTVESWIAVTLALPKIGPNRLYGDRHRVRSADVARA